MKRFLFISIVILHFSCSDEESVPDLSCRDAFQYSISGETINLFPVSEVVFIEFLKKENADSQIRSLFEAYDFLDERFFPKGSSLDRVILRLNSSTCESLYEALFILNSDPKIFAATARFKPEIRGILSQEQWTLVNGITIQPKREEEIEAVLEWSKTNGLELQKSAYGFLEFNVADLVTGFEPLEIAMRARRDLDVLYAEASFIVPLNAWP